MTDKVTTAAAYAASGGAIGFGLTANELAAIVGAAVAILTYFTNLWFKAQHLKIARRQAEVARSQSGQCDQECSGD